ncbi:MAG: hypothetical protein NTY36_11300 [Deltaproteobacteria bacterium]|nr:hypothetical protein [Deltaproteobacteria bacterium]
MKTLPPIILALMAAMLLSTPAIAYNYSFTTMDVPGYASTELRGINDAGQISGSCFTSTDSSHGVLYYGGQYSIFDVPGAVGTTEGAGIDALGRIVGSYSVAGVWHGFQDDHGSFINPLNFPNATNTYASGINAKSQIVGYSTGGPSGQIGFLYSGGSYSPVIAPGAQNTLALGITDAGEVLGFYVISGTLHGFIFYNNKYTTIDNQAADTILYGKNAAGLIVGAGRDNSNHMHGFLFDGKTFTAIEPSVAVQSWAYGINRRGQIVGSYIDQSNKTHGFLATPKNGVIAPSQILLLD